MLSLLSLEIWVGHDISLNGFISWENEMTQLFFGVIEIDILFGHSCKCINQMSMRSLHWSQTLGYLNLLSYFQLWLGTILSCN